MKISSLTIRTPEGIVFSQSLAGPVTRFLAWLIDILCIGALLSVVGTVLGFLHVLDGNMATAAGTLGYFVVSFSYGIFLEWTWRGQTIGKKLFRLRVVDAQGMRLQFDQVVTRNLLRAVDMLPGLYLIGGASCWLNRKCQRLGDIAANTIVIHSPKVAEPDLDQLLTGKFNSLRQHPHLAARLRQRVSPAEATAALQALIRRNEFEPLARVELFEQLARHFRSKVEFPPEASDGVGEEQYVRNVIDVIYRTRADAPTRAASPAQS
jgi:uncharacterized RDD family membrane protein YckC